MGRTETDRKITSELWSSMPGRMNTKENEREKLFQVKRKKSAQKVFDRADTVRDPPLATVVGKRATSVLLFVPELRTRGGEKLLHRFIASVSPLKSLRYKYRGFQSIRTPPRPNTAMEHSAIRRKILTGERLRSRFQYSASVPFSGSVSRREDADNDHAYPGTQCAEFPNSRVFDRERNAAMDLATILIQGCSETM
jgi:hypothetical protein